jgi:UDP-N-acetylmuramoylalanine--D-glutamate ligase
MAVSRLLATYGAAPFISEQGHLSDEDRKTLTEWGVDFEEGGHTEEAWNADAVVPSPGVPDSSLPLRMARKRGLPVYSELEVAYWFCDARIVAVTGTNGKTTTTSLAGHILREAGRSVFVAGNIGMPFSTVVLEAGPSDVVVLEVSSFQLDHILHFRPQVGVLLNITPDHLDRYEGRANLYAQSKWRLFENQGRGDTLVYNADDPIVCEGLLTARLSRAVRTVPFSLEQELDYGAFIREDSIFLRIDSDREVPLMPVKEVALRGRHNLYNTLAAAVSARAMEVRDDIVRSSLGSFAGVPHRLEVVGDLNGVRYINDSKATNVNAVWYALESMQGPVVLIAGGRDKGNDYESLRPLVRSKVSILITIGEGADTIAAELGPEAERTMRADSIEHAVHLAHLLAEEGDVVLLSPACASFDMFKDYQERGDRFREAVQGLLQPTSASTEE